MGAATPLPPGLTEADRASAATAALRDGTAARIRDLHGWTRADFARRCNVTTHRLAEWERGTELPTRASAVKVWRVMVAACILPPAPETEPGP